jgi:hypothetical protein
MTFRKHLVLQKAVVFIFTLLWCVFATAQSSSDSTSWIVPSFFVHSGQIIKNYPEFPERKAAVLGEVALGFRYRENKYWHQAMRFPEAGLSVTGGLLGNASVLGSVIALNPYLKWKLNRSRSWHLHLKTGLGFAWFFNPYNEVKNPGNTLAGSSLANITQASVGATVPISSRWNFTAGVSMFHFSNGHTRLPNLGINLPCFFAGLSGRNPSNEHPYPRKSEPDSAKSRFQMMVEWVGGLHEFGESTEPTGGASYPVYGLAIGFRWLPDKLHAFTASAEWNYYSSFRDFAVLNHMATGQLWLYSSTAVVYAGHEYLLGHLAIDTRIGFYVYNPFRSDYDQKILKQSSGAKLYNTNKLGLNWYFRDPGAKDFNIRLGLYIKANLGQADYASASVALIL